MKKIILSLMLFAAIAIEGSSQSSFTYQGSATATVTNAGSDTLDLTVTQSYPKCSIQPVVTKVSGTVGGVARLYGSVDGVNFIATGDTLALSNVTINTGIWTKDYLPYYKLRMVVTGTGTMSATAIAKFIGRK